MPEVKDKFAEERPGRRREPRVAHEDGLALLNSSANLERKLNAIQQSLLERVPAIDRIAVVTYNRDTDMLKTYLSCGHKAGLKYYDAKLAQSASLARIVELHEPRVVNDLRVFNTSPSPHSRALRDTGFRSSYTVPMYENETFWGFVFFNSLHSWDGRK